MVEVEHVFFVETAMDAAAIMDNARMCGAETVKAELMRNENVYRVEYTTPEEDAPCRST